MSNSPLPESTAPRRTLGLMLAIGGVLLFLGLIPLAPAALIGAIALGGHFIKPDDPAFWLPGIAGVLTVIASVVAWIGRPPASRQAFLTVATLSMGVDLVVNSRPTLMTDQGHLFGSSIDSGIHVLGICLAVIQIAVFIFALWYVNRAPSRAFYRRSVQSKNS